MNDFLAKVVGEFVFHVLLRLIERIGTSAYVNDVVHSIQERLTRRGPIAAARSAFCALPHAVGSRFALGLQLLPVTVVRGTANCAPAVTFGALLYAIFILAFKVFIPIVTSDSMHWYPRGVASLLSVVLVGLMVLACAHFARLLCVAIAEGDSVTRANLWVIASGTGLAWMLFHRPFVTATLHQDIALNFVLPALAGALVAWIVFRIDDAIWVASRRGKYGPPADGWAHYNELTTNGYVAVSRFDPTRQVFWVERRARDARW